MLYARGMGYYRDILTANKDPSPLKIRTWIRSSRSAKARPVPLLPRIRSRATIRLELLRTEARASREHWQFRIENNPFIWPADHGGGYSARELFRGISSRPEVGKKRSHLEWKGIKKAERERERENRRWDTSVDTNDETKLLVIKRGKRKRGAVRRVLETVESLTWFREIILPFGSGAARGFLLSGFCRKTEEKMEDGGMHALLEIRVTGEA